VKRKLGRRISAIAGDPNTISAVAEQYYNFSGITDQVRYKYRRTIAKLTDQVGDIPLSHLNATKLREFRDIQSSSMTATYLKSMFTPVRGIFPYAVTNDIIDLCPMPSVPMPKEKRSVQMRKWQPFTPKEAQRIFEAMDRHWGTSVRGLSDKRRLAIHMAVRVQAFTCMRPKEVLTLRPENVTTKWIKVIGSKTVGSDRTIPLHPEIADFPAFYHAGGFDTFKSQKKDQVQTVRTTSPSSSV
jgi:integrase